MLRHFTKSITPLFLLGLVACSYEVEAPDNNTFAGTNTNNDTTPTSFTRTGTAGPRDMGLDLGQTTMTSFTTPRRDMGRDMRVELDLARRDLGQRDLGQGDMDQVTDMEDVEMNLDMTMSEDMIPGSDLGMSFRDCSPFASLGCTVLNTYFKASNTERNDRFGTAIAISGDTIAVGAPLEDSDATGAGGIDTSNGKQESGAVYIFEKTSGQGWAQTAYIKASNTGLGDAFGASLALDGDLLAVGAPGEDSNATGIDGDQADNDGLGNGAVYLFKRTQGTWNQVAYVKPGNMTRRGMFGHAVAVDGGRVLVGAPQENGGDTGVNGKPDEGLEVASGAAYLFEEDAQGRWSQTTYFKASNTDAFDNFGWSVDIDGKHVVVGAYREDSNQEATTGSEQDNSADSSGAAYVFEQDTQNDWSQVAYLKASNTELGDNFGWSVAIHGTLIAVGAKLEGSSATGIGGDQKDNTERSGAVYLFEPDAQGTWLQTEYIKASKSFNEAEFGSSVALEKDRLLVGSPGESSAAQGINGNQNNGIENDTGAAYLFERDAQGVWSQSALIKANEPNTIDAFGWDVALSGPTVLVSTPQEDSQATGINGDEFDNFFTSSGAMWLFTSVRP